MKKAVIFDMDGLMIDSRPIWMSAERRLVEESGKDYSIGLRKKYIGLRVQGMVQVMIREYGLPITLQEGERKLKLYAKNNFNGVKLLPGCEKLVKFLSSSKFPLAVASSAPMDMIQFVVDKFGFASDFHVVVSGEEVKNGKPAPDIFLKAADLLGVMPSSCIVLEDAPHGIKAAKAAGMKAIAVNNDPIYNADNFAEADKFVKSLEEVDIELIEQVFGA